MRKLLLTTSALTLIGAAALAEPLDLEIDELTLGFIKLTDMAPLAIAYEKGFFEDEGLYVTLEPQANWKVLLDRVISASSTARTCWRASRWPPPSATAPRRKSSRPFSMDLNGNAITVSNEVWEAMRPRRCAMDGDSR